MAAKDTEDQKSEDQEQEISLDMSQAAVKKMAGFKKVANAMLAFGVV